MADPRQTKRSFLRDNGTLNPRPQDVKNETFQDSDFFDSDDLLQVKYEMLRLVEVDKQSVSEAAKAFGFSRPSFYQAQAAFQDAGLSGLLPHKRGPRSGHKLTPDLMSFVAELRSGRSAHFQSAIGQSNCRALWRLSSPAQHRPAVAPSKKTPVSVAPVAASLNDRRLLAAYEELRSQAVEQWTRGPGLALMRTRGFRCWMEACRQLLDAPSRSGIRACRTTVLRLMF